MTNPDVRALHHYNVDVKKLKKMKSIMKLCGKVARMLVGLAKSSEAYRRASSVMAAFSFISGSNPRVDLLFF